MENQPQLASGRQTRRRSILGRWWAPGDVLIVLLVVALSVFLISRSIAGAGGTSGLEASISVNGKEVMTRSLQNGNEQIAIEGYRGESYIEISEGRVRMVDSDCPDKLCVRTGWISRPGESIVCLPNKVVIEIKSGEGGPDAINR
jgi:hypothetical protein